MRPATQTAAVQLRTTRRPRAEARDFRDALVVERETEDVVVLHLRVAEIVFVEREQAERPLTARRPAAAVGCEVQLRPQPKVVAHRAAREQRETGRGVRADRAR